MEISMTELGKEHGIQRVIELYPRIETLVRTRNAEEINLICHLILRCQVNEKWSGLQQLRRCCSILTSRQRESRSCSKQIWNKSRFNRAIVLGGRADPAESLLCLLLRESAREGTFSSARCARVAKKKEEERKKRKCERERARSKTFRDNRPYLRLAAFDAIFCSSDVPFILASLLELS